MMKAKATKKRFGWIWLFCLVLLCGCARQGNPLSGETTAQISVENVEDIPAYSGQPYVVIHDNEPDFPNPMPEPVSYETYSDLDALGRCGVAEACVGQDLMPVEKRGSIGQVRPSGWQTIKYDQVDGKYLYNRCHLIGYQLTAENANEKNLITGTRYMNVDGMLPFENMVADYIKETGNHVLYRVTPVFLGDDLVAVGVQMEAKSVEDDGEGITYNVFVYNVQPGLTIDYATGDSRVAEEDSDGGSSGGEIYILSTGSQKFHKTSCASVDTIKKENRETFDGDREELILQGYEPCGRCKP